MAGIGVQVMYEILMPLPTCFLILFSDIRTVVILHFCFVLQTINNISKKFESLKFTLRRNHTKEYEDYLDKVSV